MYRLLALDIDDTITLQPKTVPDEILKAVDRAREYGIRVTLATGRSYTASECIIRQMGITEPVVNYGGAVVSDPKDGSVLYSSEVPNALIHELLSDAHDMGVHIHIYEGDTVICERHNGYIEAYTAKLSLPWREEKRIRELDWHGVPKALMMTEDERAAELIPYFQKRYAGRLKVSGSSKGFIEFNHPDSHKGSGVKWVAEHLRIPRGEVAAVGDNSLDLEMVQWAGLGCAVANAKEQLRAAADLIIPSCEEFGVAHLIDNVLIKHAKGQV